METYSHTERKRRNILAAHSLFASRAQLQSLLLMNVFASRCFVCCCATVQAIIVAVFPTISTYMNMTWDFSCFSHGNEFKNSSHFGSKCMSKMLVVHFFSLVFSLRILLHRSRSNFQCLVVVTNVYIFTNRIRNSFIRCFVFLFRFWCYA